MANLEIGLFTARIVCRKPGVKSLFEWLLQIHNRFQLPISKIRKDIHGLALRIHTKGYCKYPLVWKGVT